MTHDGCSVVVAKVGRASWQPTGARAVLMSTWGCGRGGWRREPPPPPLRSAWAPTHAVICPIGIVHKRPSLQMKPTQPSKSASMKPARDNIEDRARTFTAGARLGARANRRNAWAKGRGVGGRASRPGGWGGGATALWRCMRAAPRPPWRQRAPVTGSWGVFARNERAGRGAGS